MTQVTELTAERLVPLLSTTDVAASADFYGRLGFRRENEWSKDGRLRWCMMSYPGGASVMLQQDDNPEKPGRGTGVTLYVWCSDALAFHERASAEGIETDDPFVGNGMDVVQFRDPDGYRVAFQSPVNETTGEAK